LGSRERVAAFLSSSGVPVEIKEFGESTRNSELAAQALGCSVAEIAKSVVFVGKSTAVVILSGDRTVDVTKLSELVGEDLRIAKPDEVRNRTSFPIGGVPPFPHADGVAVLPDSSLMRFQEVWAAAGTPNAVFRITSSDLIRLVGNGPFELSQEVKRL
jgi:prolyl-tRNA editing enzyme YbaK/EbsC (Cys-tRNA(Pro) deacylase)